MIESIFFVTNGMPYMLAVAEMLLDMASGGGALATSSEQRAGKGGRGEGGGVDSRPQGGWHGACVDKFILY